MNDGKGVIIMQNPNKYQTNRPHMIVLTNKLIMVKENSWISLIIHIIILILVGITCYSMYKQPILNFVLANQAIDFSEIKIFKIQLLRLDHSILILVKSLTYKV